jgi:hypothetical protein
MENNAKFISEFGISSSTSPESYFQYKNVSSFVT